MQPFRGVFARSDRLDDRGSAVVAIPRVKDAFRLHFRIGMRTDSHDNICEIGTRNGGVGNILQLFTVKSRFAGVKRERVACTDDFFDTRHTRNVDVVVQQTLSVFACQSHVRNASSDKHFDVLRP